MNKACRMIALQLVMFTTAVLVKTRLLSKSSD